LTCQLAAYGVPIASQAGQRRVRRDKAALRGGSHRKKMSIEEPQQPERPTNEVAPDEEVPAIEDAYEPDESAEPVVDEDDPALLTHALEPDAADGSTADAGDVASAEKARPSPQAVGEEEVAGDADTIDDEPEAAETSAEPCFEAWFDRDTSSRRIAVELKRVELEVRDLLEGRDNKRKRKLAGTRRWLELEEDVISWRYTDRFDQRTLDRLQQLIVRRHFLFRRLRFLAGTRRTWNT
jgi:hypothetical protein